MIPIIKTMLINLGLIIIVSIGLYYLKDRVNRFFRRRIRRTSRKIQQYNNRCYKKRINKVEKDKLTF